MSDKHLSIMVQYNLETGEKKIVSTGAYVAVYQYFKALHILNKSARSYGVSYLATDDWLQILRDTCGE